MDLLEVKHRNDTQSDVQRHPWELARLEVLKTLISKNVSLADRSLVLDIGCGDTFVVEQLALDYPRVSFYAVDIAFTEELMDVFRKNLKVKNVSLFRSLDDIPENSSQNAALVLLTDVIEHIEDDKKFMAELLKNKLVDGRTLFLITVPAYQALFCSHDKFLGHYRRYTNVLLKKNLTIAGLKIVTAGYFFFSLLPLRLLQVLKEKIVGVDPKAISTGLVKWENGNGMGNVLKSLLTLDANVSFFLKRIGLNFPGLSNYAICRKSA